MNTNSNSSDSFLDRIGLGGLIIIALLVLTLVVAISRGMPKMERDLQGRASAVLQAVGVETSPDSLHFEGRDAHLTLPAGSTVDEQVVSEKLREVRGVRRVFLTREDGGEIAASGEPAEEGDEKREPVAAAVEEESAVKEGAKLGLVDVGDGGASQTAAPSAPAAVRKEELSDAIPTDGGAASEVAHPMAQRETESESESESESDSKARLPGAGGESLETQSPASTAVATTQTGMPGATGAQLAQDGLVDAGSSMATSAGVVEQEAPGVATAAAEAGRSTGASPPLAAPLVTAGQAATNAVPAVGEAVVQSPAASASGDQRKAGDGTTVDEPIVDEPIVDEPLAQAENAVPRMTSDEAMNAGTVAGQGGQATDAAEIVGAQGESIVGIGAEPEADKEPAPGVAQEPRLDLEFDPASIRVSGKVVDQAAIQQVEETLRSAASRDISFALSTGSAGGSMPWLAGAAEVVAGLQPDDHGRMTMSEGGGVGIQIPPGSTSQGSAITERLKQRFMSAYPDVDAAPDDAGAEQVRTGAQAAASSSVAGDSADTGDMADGATRRNPAGELNELLGSNTLFATGSYRVSGELEPMLDQIADYFKTNPGLAVGLTARPDAGVIFPFSFVVGVSRAFAVRSYLILKGIQPANVLVGDPPLGVSPTGKRQIEFYKLKVMF